MLSLGDTGNWDISSTSTAAPDNASIPRLRSLTLSAGSIDIGELDLPELRELAIQTGSLSREAIQQICLARLPQLERLEIWFGDPEYGASGGVEDIATILSATAHPGVIHLGLRNCAFADAIAEQLPTSRILPHLKTLDLSMGNLSDRGLAVLLAERAAFAHLESLDVSDNALTDAHWPAVRELAKHVTFGNKHDPDRAVPRDADGHGRYVSVGE